MNSLNFHHLQYFWIVCQEASFTKAAQKLRLSQSSISIQVRQLEQYLGQSLIARTTRRFELTEAGQMAFKYAQTIFETGQELVDFMKHRPNPEGQLVRLGALGSLSRNLQAAFLSPLIDQKNVKFSVTTGDSNRLLKLLRDHQLDIVLSTFPASQDDAADLYTHLITQSPLCLVASSQLVARSPVRSAHLLEQHKVFLPTTVLESRSGLNEFLESEKLQIQVAGEVDDIALLRTLALLGKGLVIVPKLGVAGDIKNGALKLIREFRSINQRFFAITRQKRFPNPLISSLVRSLKAPPQ